MCTVLAVSRKQTKMVIMMSTKSLLLLFNPTCGGGTAYLLRSLWWGPPGGLLHLATRCDRSLGHGAVLSLLAGGGWDRGWGRRGGGWGRGGRRRCSPEDGHLLCGCEAQAAQAFMCLVVHHQQPGLIVHSFDPLYHLRDGTVWHGCNLLVKNKERTYCRCRWAITVWIIHSQITTKRLLFG